MTLGERLKTLRKELGIQQNAMGDQGFISTPGWIKIEQHLRPASELLIRNLIQWLVAQKHVKPAASKALQEELLTLKYLESSSPFVRELARAHALSLPNGAALLIPTEKAKPVRRRPKTKR